MKTHNVGGAVQTIEFTDDKSKFIINVRDATNVLTGNGRVIFRYIDKELLGVLQQVELTVDELVYAMKLYSECKKAVDEGYQITYIPEAC